MLGGGKDIRPRSGRMGHGIHGTGMAMVGKIRRNSPLIAPRLKRQDRLFSKDLSDPPHGGTIMSEQNEVVIRKVHDGYLVELLDCPLAYTFSSQDEAERFIGPVWQRLDYVKDLHSQALRAENQRLREALATIARYGKDGICPYGCDTPYIAQAALQPKEVQP